MAADEPVQQALDHLLDPLGALEVEKRDVWDEPFDGSQEVWALASRGELSTLLLRIRRSGRLLYRVPRLLVAWTALVAGISGLIWIAFGLGGLK